MATCPRTTTEKKGKDAATGVDSTDTLHVCKANRDEREEFKSILVAETASSKNHHRND